ncbi:hypothetical protein MTR67_026541, partial [Solanum verrucosum]
TCHHGCDLGFIELLAIRVISDCLLILIYREFTERCSGAEV